MSNAIERLDRITEKLFTFLGSISVGLTEDDFREMESLGMKPNRELIKKARDSYLLSRPQHAA